MIEIIYFEESISEHPRTLGIFERFPQATRVPCSNYQEVFNPNGQNFRLQKKKPSLILAQKEGNFSFLFRNPTELVEKQTITSPICLTVFTTADTVFFRACTHRLIMYSL